MVATEFTLVPWSLETPRTFLSIAALLTQTNTIPTKARPDTTSAATVPLFAPLERDTVTQAGADAREGQGRLVLKPELRGNGAETARRQPELKKPTGLRAVRSSESTRPQHTAPLPHESPDVRRLRSRFQDSPGDSGGQAETDTRQGQEDSRLPGLLPRLLTIRLTTWVRSSQPKTLTVPAQV